KQAVAALGEVYEGAMLEAVDSDQIPFVPRAHIWVSAKPAEPERILKLLQVCNPQMPSADWRVTRVGDPEGNSRQISVTLNEKSLDALEKVNGLLQYGCRQVSVRIYKSDTKNKKGAAEPDLEVVVVDPEKLKKD
ncbi:hypothetical protein KR067_011445, partial [Drosophila pandora]